MKKYSILLLLIPVFFLFPSCDMHYTEGTILDEFVKKNTDTEKKAVGLSVSTTAPVSMSYNLNDGYTLSGIEALLVYDDGSTENVSTKVSYSGLPFDNVGENTVTISYQEFTESLSIDYSSYTVSIGPRGIDNDFFIPEVFGPDNEDKVFVGWAEAGSDEVLEFPLLNESYEETMVITPVFKPVSQVFELDESGAAVKLLEPYYEFYGIPASITAFGDNLFYKNGTVKAVAFENGSTLSSIGEFVFYFSSLEYCEMPSSLVEIKNSAFSMVSNLKRIIWEDDPGLKTIGPNAFTGYPLDVLEIPSSVESIGRSIIGPSSVSQIVFLEGSQISSIDRYAFDYTYDVEIVFIKPLFISPPEYSSDCWGSYMSTFRIER